MHIQTSSILLLVDLATGAAAATHLSLRSQLWSATSTSIPSLVTATSASFPLAIPGFDSYQPIPTISASTTSTPGARRSAREDLRYALIKAMDPALLQVPTITAAFPATITATWEQSVLPGGQTANAQVAHTQLSSATFVSIEEAAMARAGQIVLGTLTSKIGRVETGVPAKARATAAMPEEENIASGLINRRGRWGGKDLVIGVLTGLSSVAVGMILLV